MECLIVEELEPGRVELFIDLVDSVMTKPHVIVPRPETLPVPVDQPALIDDRKDAQEAEISG